MSKILGDRYTDTADPAVEVLGPTGYPVPYYADAFGAINDDDGALGATLFDVVLPVSGTYTVEGVAADSWIPGSDLKTGSDGGAYELYMFTVDRHVAEPLRITEVMYDPASSPDGSCQWVEVYNTNAVAVDVHDFVLDNGDGHVVDAANIDSGVIRAGEVAVLYNSAITAEEFEETWGSGINLIPVSDWDALELGKDGDLIGLWGDYADYAGDHESHAFARTTVAYDDSTTWPAAHGIASIHMVDPLGAPADPEN